MENRVLPKEGNSSMFLGRTGQVNFRVPQDQARKTNNAVRSLFKTIEQLFQKSMRLDNFA